MSTLPNQTIIDSSEPIGIHSAMSCIHHCQMAKDTIIALHRPASATAEQPNLNPYVACDYRAATESMKSGMKLI
jgi:hypothetical protein